MPDYTRVVKKDPMQTHTAETHGWVYALGMTASWTGQIITINGIALTIGNQQSKDPSNITLFVPVKKGDEYSLSGGVSPSANLRYLWFYPCNGVALPASESEQQ